MIDTQFMVNKLKELTDSIDEPCCISMNMGEVAIFAQNDLMIKADAQYKSETYHAMNISLCNRLSTFIEQ